MLQKTPSTSKRGSFSSKAVHRPDPYRPDTPGPGYYTLPGIGSVKITGRGTAAFLPNGQKGRIPFPEPHKFPGPLQYEVKYDSRLTTYTPTSLRKMNSGIYLHMFLFSLFLETNSISPVILQLPCGQPPKESLF
jgi:hypothetical protein